MRVSRVVFFFRQVIFPQFTSVYTASREQRLVLYNLLDRAASLPAPTFTKLTNGGTPLFLTIKLKGNYEVLCFTLNIVNGNRGEPKSFGFKVFSVLHRLGREEGEDQTH